MSTAYYRRSDDDLLAWAKHFAVTLAATPGAFFVTGEQVARVTQLTDAFETALRRWQAPETRTPVASVLKREARAALLSGLQFVVGVIRIHPDIGDAGRVELGIGVRKTRQRVPKPTEAPDLRPIRVEDREVTLVIDAPGGTGLAEGAAGVTLASCEGERPSPDAADWVDHGIATTRRTTLTFNHSAEAGTVWIVARFFNPRGELGPVSTPVRVNLPAASRPVFPNRAAA